MYRWRTLMLQHSRPYRLLPVCRASNCNTYVPCMDARRGPKTSLMAPVKWHEEKCLKFKRQFGRQQQSQLYRKKNKNIEAVSFVWTFDENASRLKVMPSFHFYICPISAFFLMFTLCFVFMWMLNCTRGNKGQEKWSLFCLKHQKLWIRQLYISYLASYLCSEQKRNDSISILRTR